MVEDALVPLLRSHPGRGPAPRLGSVTVAGIREVDLGRRIEDLMERGRDPVVGSYPKLGRVVLTVESRASRRTRPRRRVEATLAEIERRLGDAVVGRGDLRLNEVVAGILLERGTTIAIAESLTGGLIADGLVAVPGISRGVPGGMGRLRQPRQGRGARCARSRSWTSDGAVSEACVPRDGGRSPRQERRGLRARVERHRRARRAAPRRSPWARSGSRSRTRRARSRTAPCSPATAPRVRAYACDARLRPHAAAAARASAGSGSRRPRRRELVDRREQEEREHLQHETVVGRDELPVDPDGAEHDHPEVGEQKQSRRAGPGSSLRGPRGARGRKRSPRGRRRRRRARRREGCSRRERDPAGRARGGRARRSSCRSASGGGRRSAADDRRRNGSPCTCDRRRIHGAATIAVRTSAVSGAHRQARLHERGRGGRATGRRRRRGPRPW